MKALIQKDVYVLWKQMKIFVIVMLVIMAGNGSFGSVFVVIWCAMLPYTALAYDERCKWDQLAAMMPYSTRDIVLSKYVLGWLCMAAAMALSLVFQTAASAFTHESPVLSALAMSFLGGMIALDITLPMVLRFGVERGRWGFLMIIFGVAALGGAIAGMAEDLPSVSLPAMALLPLAAVIATAVSIPLSIKLYKAN